MTEIIDPNAKSPAAPPHEIYVQTIYVDKPWGRQFFGMRRGGAETFHFANTITVQHMGAETTVPICFDIPGTTPEEAAENFGALWGVWIKKADIAGKKHIATTMLTRGLNMPKNGSPQ